MFILGTVCGILHAFICVLILPYFAIPAISIMTLSDESRDAKMFGVGYTISVITWIWILYGGLFK